MARKCVFCGGTPVTSEHVFRRAYRKRIRSSRDREFTQRKIGNSLMTARPEAPFDCQVKRVCRKCNNGWMNRLDNSVDSWVFDPTSTPSCTIQDFRRWAIKIAILRAMIDQPNAVPRDDYTTLFQGEDVPKWRVYVGHTDYAEFRHAFAGTSGAMPVNPDGSMDDGLVHVSWVVGNAFTCAIRILGPTGEIQADLFEEYNFNSGQPLAQIYTAANGFPSFEVRPRLEFPRQVMSLTWFYTPESESPIAHMMQS